MKILHLITTINRGGAENQLLTLVREQIREGLDVSIAPLKGNLELKGDFEEAGAKVISHQTNLIWIRQIFKIRDIITKESFQIVHAHLPRSELTAALCTRKHEFLVTRHNAEAFYTGAPKFLSRLMSKFVENRSFKIVCISKAVSDFLLTNGEISSQPPVIHYGRNINKITERYSDSKAKLLSSLNIPSDSKIISTLARLTSQKDIGTLLEAFSILLKKEPSAWLLIAGSGPLEESLKKLCEELGIQAKVKWLGQINETSRVYMASDIFVLTSRYEGFGLVLLEAMEFHVPIVASNNTSIPEVLGKDHPGLVETGNYLLFAEKISYFLNSENAKKLLATQDKQLEKFDIVETSKQHNLIYSEILKHR